MKCPVCSNPLREFNAGSYAVDICDQGCSGIWFDKDELEKCDEDSEPFPKELLRVRKVASVVIDRTKPRSCPRCESVTMQNVSLNRDRHFSIDNCPQCGGHWLDIGELEMLRNDAKQMAEVEAHQAAFQKRIQNDPAAQKRSAAFFRVLFK